MRHRRLPSTLVLGLIALLLALRAPLAALAHPLDVYLQATYITVAPTQLTVELDLSPGALVAPQVLPQLDTNGDQQIADAEGQAYVDAILHNVVLQVDGSPLSLAVSKFDMPEYLTMQAGYGTIRIFTIAKLPDGMMGTHQIYYKNNYAPTGSAYQVNAFVDKGVAITLGKQKRDSIQQSMTMDYAIGSASTARAASAADLATNTTSTTTGTTSLDTPFGTLAGASDHVRHLLGYLNGPALSPWALLLALALAGVLGGLHALTPGHGKTLVTAYLVGSRGTVCHAVALGSIVTVTHTSSVMVIGLLALFASQFIVPKVLVPMLEITAGLLVVFMGIRLVWQRWTALHSRKRVDDVHGHDHDDRHHHTHDHRHSHLHEGDHAHAYTHDHGDRHPHSHLPPAEGITLGNLLALGVSGGLVPCPEALGIMVIAIGLNRILLGLGLIVSFSFGLAAVLIVIGILLVRSRSLLERLGGVSSCWRSALPLVSAVIVTALGVGITLGGLTTLLR
jgi:nickel/cobalt transporter (NicO) family protein